MNLKFMVIALFAFNFLLVNAENYIIPNGNQTIRISVNPNITVEPQNLTKIENLIETLTNKPDWTHGDIIISSSTIVAFFTFGSFLVLRFEGKNRYEKYEAMKIVLMSVALIQIMHLWMIGAVITNSFSTTVYVLVIILTIFLILYILSKILNILELTRNEEEKDELRDDDITPLKTLLTQEIAKRVQAEEQRDNVQRELNKNKREAGN